MVIVEGPEVRVYTNTLTAVFDQGVLVSLVRKSDGREFITGKTADKAPLSLVFGSNDVSRLGAVPGDKTVCLQMSKYRADVRVHGWYGDGLLAVSEDAETGDLIVEPSAYSSRPGLRACRWNVYGIDKGLDLVAPFFQGVRLPFEDELIADTSWGWPAEWEAALAVLAGPGGGVWVHARDTQFRYKSLQVGLKDDPRTLGFETENYGPREASLAAGGLAWRINVYTGDWKVPAASYRDWLWKAYRLDEKTRPDWVQDLRFAVSWCPCDNTLLDALKARLDPKKVLLHVSNWRTDPYDENYPTYVASDKAAAFIKRAREMGFRAMPHCNAVDMDPVNPVYNYVRDFRYRSLETKRVMGWTWVDGNVLPVPESNEALLHNRDKKTMVKIHNGLAMWRSMLAENIAAAAASLGIETMFLDVTLGTYNLNNCLVECQTSTEGMNRLIELVSTLGDGLAVGGEGRNEMNISTYRTLRRTSSRVGRRTPPASSAPAAHPSTNSSSGDSAAPSATRTSRAEPPRVPCVCASTPRSAPCRPSPSAPAPISPTLTPP